MSITYHCLNLPAVAVTSNQTGSIVYKYINILLCYVIKYGDLFNMKEQIIVIKIYKKSMIEYTFVSLT